MIETKRITFQARPQVCNVHLCVHVCVCVCVCVCACVCVCVCVVCVCVGVGVCGGRGLCAHLECKNSSIILVVRKYKYTSKYFGVMQKQLLLSLYAVSLKRLQESRCLIWHQSQQPFGVNTCKCSTCLRMVS